VTFNQLLLCYGVQASYFVFDKVHDESSAGRGAGAGDSAEIKLRTLLSVPRSVAGRIIGRQGRNVREIQRLTGATVRLMDDEEEEEDDESDETTAEIYGNFMATQVHSLSFPRHFLVFITVRASIVSYHIENFPVPPLLAERLLVHYRVQS